MPNKHGDFTWYELTTTDVDPAMDFYSKVLGWTWEKSEGQPGMPYYLCSMNGTQIGGMMALTDEMIASGAQPCWLGYIGVDDVDKSAEEIKAAGGSVHIPPTDIPGIGRFAMVTDPQGAYFYIMQDSSGNESESFAATEPRDGHCAWNELMTTDPGAAMQFYTGQFGWQKDGEMDMGPMGKYEMLRHDFMLGAIMPKPDEVPMSMWSFYFRVADIDKAVKAIRDNGGNVTLEPDEIPGGDYQINAIDPQGAPFALVGARS